jgi:hypothetical protein
MGVFDILGELGSAFPYIYRGWFWLLSSSYRKKLKSKFLREPKWRCYLDALLSTFFVIAEIALFIVIVKGP